MEPAVGSLRWTTIALVAVAAVGLAVGWALFFGPSLGGVSSVESNSMSHGPGSMTGVLDPGEWHRLEPVSQRDQVLPYYQAKPLGHRVGDDWGDVITYRPVVGGQDRSTPEPGGSVDPLMGSRGLLIQHRAILWLDYNESADGYDVPALNLTGVTHFTVPEVGTVDPLTDRYVHVAMEVRLDPQVTGRHGGWLTKGDNNPLFDQDIRGGLRGLGTPELVIPEMAHGRVVGHLDDHWILAIQIGVPVAALGIAGGVYAWRRRAAGDGPVVEGTKCPGCGAAGVGEEGFCYECGAEQG